MTVLRQDQFHAALQKEFAKYKRSGKAMPAGRYTPDFRRDADETIFFKRQLTWILPELLRVRRPPLNAERLIPSSSRANAFAKQTGYHMSDGFALPAPIKGKGSDVPRVGVSGSETLHPVVMYGLAAGWDIEEIGAAMELQVPLETRYLEEMTRGFAENRNSLAWYGDRDLGIEGMLSNPNIFLNTLQTSGGTDVTVDDNSTPDDIINALGTLIRKPQRDTTRAFAANQLWMCTAAYDHIAQTPRSAQSDRTILEFLQGTNPGVSFTDVEELDLANTSLAFGAASELSDDFIIAAQNTSLVMEQQVPMPMRMLDLRDDGAFAFLLPAAERVGSVHVPYPRAVSIARNVLGNATVS